MPSLHCQRRAIEEAEKREKELRMREELEFRTQKVRERTLRMLDRPRSTTADISSVDPVFLCMVS